MASYITRNGRIRAQVWIKPLPQQAKTFASIEAAKAWAEPLEASLREIRRNGGTPSPEMPKGKMPRRRDEVARLARFPMKAVFCGVYFLFNGDECVYVGKSANVHTRVTDHAFAGSKDFDSYAWVPCSVVDVDRWELYYIKLLSPRYNIAGRPHFAETIAILRASDELPKGTPKSLGDNSDLPESILSIMGATEK